MNALLQDFRFAVRTFRKVPGFTAVIILTLALGIGANTAIFTVVNAVLLTAVPYRDPGKLVYLRAMKGTQEWSTVSGPDFIDWKAQARSFKSMAVYNWQGENLAGGTQPIYVSAPQVSQGFFETFELKPQLGRLFNAEDYAGRAPVAVLSDALWSSQFGRDPNIIGRSITLAGSEATVVGVAEPGFDFPRAAQVWTPFNFDTRLSQLRDAHFLWAIARLNPGATLAQAQAEMEGIARRLEQQYPDSNSNRGVAVLPFHEASVRFIRPMLLMLSLAVGLVLLIVCANVGNLYMSRALARRQEIATRMALGARVGRLTRQMLTESVLLAVAGGVVGLMLAQWAVAALISLAPAGQFPRYARVTIDGRVLGFTLAVSFVAGILFGVAPAMGAARANLFDTLKLGGLRSGRSRGASVYRNTLVVAQLALAVMLLAAGGLMLRSMQQLLRVQPGFDPESVLSFELPMPRTSAAQVASRVREVDELQTRLAQLPQAQSAAYALFLPLDGNNMNGGFEIQGRPHVAESLQPVAEERFVGPQFFATLGIRMLRGRDFSERDSNDAPKVAVINRAMAEHFWPGADPVGQHISFGDENSKAMWTEIVGVVEDVHDFGLGSTVRWEVYMPLAQTGPFLWTMSQNPTVRFAVRARGDSAALAPEIARAVHAVDATQPVNDVRLLTKTVRDSLAAPRFGATLLGVFAALGLVIALAGIYSVLSWAVAQRTPEIGIRLAIGATRKDILGLVLGEASVLLACSLAIGLGGALAVGRLMRNMLFGTSSANPVILLMVVVVVSGVAIAASYLPARRAAQVDPMVALRRE